MATEPKNDVSILISSGERSSSANESSDIIVSAPKEAAGWEDVSITLRAEGFPNSFSVSASVPANVPKGKAFATAGDRCAVRIGGTLVVTGFVDRGQIDCDATSHRYTITGRGKTCDLADCSAEMEGGQIFSGTALTIAERLVTPYAITVQLANGSSPGEKLPPTLLDYGETAADIIQRVARNAGLLAYESSEGDLILSGVGTEVAASGAVYGKNVQAYSVMNSMEDRFSEIVCARLAQDTLMELGEGGNFYHTEHDQDVKRHRLKYLLVEGGGAPQDGYDGSKFTIRRARWEVARRFGKAHQVKVVLDSWRDGAGKLWKPNTMVPVDVPGFRLPDKELCLTEVTFRQSNESGTTAELTLLPKAGLVPEPLVLVQANLAGLNS